MVFHWARRRRTGSPESSTTISLFRCGRALPETGALEPHLATPAPTSCVAWGTLRAVAGPHQCARPSRASNASNPTRVLDPTIVEQTPAGDRVYDIYSMLVKNRVVLIGTPIDSALADLIVVELLYLQQQDPDQGIQLYINSPGGEVGAGLDIYDAMHLVQPKVATTCVGSADGNRGAAARRRGARHASGSAQCTRDPPAVDRGRGQGGRHRFAGERSVAP
jgi:hypothetical protein